MSRKTKTLLSTITRNQLIGTGIAYMKNLLGYVDDVADEVDKLKWKVEKLEARYKLSSKSDPRDKRGKKEKLPAHLEKDNLPIGP